MTEPWQYGLEETIGYVREREAEYDAIYIDSYGINQPYIYVLFYARWPPSEVHETLNVRRVRREIGRYRFQPPRDLPPGLRAEELEVLYHNRDPAISVPSERPLYEVRGGEAASGERVLVVRKLA